MSETSIRTGDAAALGLLDAHDQAALVRRGEVSAGELVEAAITRIEALDPVLNAVSHTDFAAARSRAAVGGTGGLAGVPYLLKDSVSYPGMPSRSASAALDDSPASAMFPFVARLEEQGLIPLGKTTMSEFGLLPSNESRRYGVTRNPWNAGHTTGGSSGGAGSAVASGMVPVAHASDAAGSIRIPASCCGLVGLKASRGANVRARARHLFDDILCSDGVLARSVRDVAWVFAAVHADGNVSPVDRGPDGRLRIGLMLEAPGRAQPHPAVSEAIERTAALCEGLGHRVEPVALPFDGDNFIAAFKTLWAYLGADVADFCRNRFPDRPLGAMLEDWPIGLSEWADTLGGLDLERSYRLFGDIPPAYEALFGTFDVILSPVMAEHGVAIERFSGMRPWRALLDDMMDVIPYTPVQNVTGNPSISLPVTAALDGMPVGSMFTAARGQDNLLLALALELEAAAPWSDRWPETSAATLAISA
ncbi:MAG: hypothetical protein J0H88_03000 [Sphingomonadales bacterium]|nr:hypothetical protein [Sphingomonadales bacterium]